MPLLASLLLAFVASPAIAAETPLAGTKKVLFLGDSITYSGQYIEIVEAVVRTRDPQLETQFLNMGLPSETVSGLSEPGHAGGKFPRPDLHERLDRVLALTKPDLIVACYGMNCGIYHPFSEERFAKYQAGITKLREKAAAIQCRVLFLTPAVFDPVPIKGRTLPAGRQEYTQPYEGYNDVLDRYTAWLLEQKKTQGWAVVDVHGPINEHLKRERERDPAYKLAGDGVHPNAVGQWLMAKPLLVHWGVPAEEVAQAKDATDLLKAHPKGAEVLKLIQERQRVQKDAWLTKAGHQRPGMNAGLPFDEAQSKASALEGEISSLVWKK